VPFVPIVSPYFRTVPYRGQWWRASVCVYAEVACWDGAGVLREAFTT
jgi:hypothetical protein